MRLRKSTRDGCFFVARIKERMDGVILKITCTKTECLNNKNKICTAHAVFYDGRCQTYETAHGAMKSKGSIVRRKHGRLKQREGEVIK